MSTSETTRMHPRTYNWLLLPLVVLVRLPVMLPLLFVAKAGEMAEAVGDMVGPWLPGFRHNPESRSRF